MDKDRLKLPRLADVEAPPQPPAPPRPRAQHDDPVQPASRPLPPQRPIPPQAPHHPPRPIARQPAPPSFPSETPPAPQFPPASVPHQRYSTPPIPLRPQLLEPHRQSLSRLPSHSAGHGATAYEHGRAAHSQPPPSFSAPAPVAGGLKSLTRHQSAPANVSSISKPKKLHREVEQKRRMRMAEQIMELRKWVSNPNGGKTDKVSVLQDAVAYVKDASQKIDELKQALERSRAECAHLRSLLSSQPRLLAPQPQETQHPQSTHPWSTHAMGNPAGSDTFRAPQPEIAPQQMYQDPHAPSGTSISMASRNFGAPLPPSSFAVAVPHPRVTPSPPGATALPQQWDRGGPSLSRGLVHAPESQHGRLTPQGFVAMEERGRSHSAQREPPGVRDQLRRLTPSPGYPHSAPPHDMGRLRQEDRRGEGEEANPTNKSQRGSER